MVMWGSWSWLDRIGGGCPIVCVDSRDVVYHIAGFHNIAYMRRILDTRVLEVLHVGVFDAWCKDFEFRGRGLLVLTEQLSDSSRMIVRFLWAFGAGGEVVREVGIVPEVRAVLRPFRALEAGIGFVSFMVRDEEAWLDD